MCKIYDNAATSLQFVKQSLALLRREILIDQRIQRLLFPLVVTRQQVRKLSLRRIQRAQLACVQRLLDTLQGLSHLRMFLPYGNGYLRITPLPLLFQHGEKRLLFPSEVAEQSVLAVGEGSLCPVQHELFQERKFSDNTVHAVMVRQQKSSEVRWFPGMFQPMRLLQQGAELVWRQMTPQDGQQRIILGVEVHP